MHENIQQANKITVGNVVCIRSYQAIKDNSIRFDVFSVIFRERGWYLNSLVIKIFFCVQINQVLNVSFENLNF